MKKLPTFYLLQEAVIKKRRMKQIHLASRRARGSSLTTARIIMLVLPNSSAPTMQSMRLRMLKQEQYKKSHHCPAGRFCKKIRKRRIISQF
jgi:hypothetical protein